MVLQVEIAADMGTAVESYMAVELQVVVELQKAAGAAASATGFDTAVAVNIARIPHTAPVVGS